MFGVGEFVRIRMYHPNSHEFAYNNLTLGKTRSPMTSSAPSRLSHPGLTAAQVEEYRRKHGANLLTPPARDPWWKQLLSKFDDPVIRILIIAAIIQIIVGVIKGEYIEGLAIVIAILLATTIAFINEFRANREFDILNKVNDEVPIKVIRDGRYTTVPRKDLVVDDIILLEAGEEAPTDGTLLEGVSLQVDESRLTGEALPVEKHVAGTVAAEKDAAYPVDRICRGTMVADGHGLIRAIAVGDSTEIGKTARAAAEETGEETPLNQQLEKLSKWIGVAGLGFAGVTFLALLFRGVVTGSLNLTSQQWVFTTIMMVGIMVALIKVWLPILYDALGFMGKEAEPPAWVEKEGIGSWLKMMVAGLAFFGAGLALGYALGWIPEDKSQWMTREVGERLLGYFMIAVVIIVVAVPEGLAMSVTLSLAYSMRKMTAQNNLVRRMHACETIGAATVICSDKTGTLTLNEMRVQTAAFPAAENGLKGFSLDGNAGLIADAVAANSTAQLSREDSALRPLGSPTEGALLLWLDSQDIDYLARRQAFEVENQLTFSTERKYMATLGRSGGRRVLHVKGAPEMLLDRCETVLTANGTAPMSERRSGIESAMRELQARGMRTLGLAYRETSEPAAEIEPLVHRLHWLGFVAIADPVRPEVPGAVAACREAGVQVKMVTGDNPITAREIGRQIGLLGDNEPATSHVSGSDFAAMTDEQASKAAADLKVLSRARPLDKLRLVRLLKEQKHVVAVTGDGTNDAPALNYADVGLAMGKTGTAVAKEASDIILLDDSFKSIVNAVMWGRSLYENIQRFIVFQLTINVAALGVALLGPFIGIDLPLTVMQMLWVNLIMDTFAALALATEPPNPMVLKRPPREAGAFIITPMMSRSIFGVGLLFLVILVVLLLVLPTDRWGESVFFSVFVLLQFWNLFNARRLGSNRSALSGIFENKGFLLIATAILVGQIVLVQFGEKVFRTQPLELVEWLLIIGLTSPVLVVGEFLRWKARTAEAAKPVVI